MPLKRCALAVVFALACPALVSAQLRFVDSNADLGEIRGGPVYQQRFEFVNNSSQPIEITNIRLGCGCLQPVLEKRRFEPGERHSLLMNIRTLGQPNGQRSWQAHVQYRVGDMDTETTLNLSAKIRNEVTVEPSIVSLTVDSKLKQVITIQDHRAMPLKITAIRPSTSALQVTTEANGKGGTKVILEVSRSDLKLEKQNETLDIYTDDPNYRHLQVPVTLVKASRDAVSATPDKVEITAGNSHLVRLRLRGEQAIRVEKAEAMHPGIVCTWAAGPGADATLKIRVNAASAPVVTNVRVQFAEPAGAVISIPVTVRKE